MNTEYIEFYRKLNKSTSVFSDVMSIAKQARALSNKSRNAISHSQAISMVLMNEKADVVGEDSVIDEYESRYIKEMFSYIDDKDIRDAVYDSFYDSKKNKNLIFTYNDIVESNKRARVRILTRILWHNLIYKGENFSMENTFETAPKKRGRRRKSEFITSNIVEIPDTVAEDAQLNNPDFIDAMPEDTTINTDASFITQNGEYHNTNAITPSIHKGDTYKLPFARLFSSSVAKSAICVCSGDVEILSEEIHDGRINVFNYGTNRKGWIDATEIK